MHRKPGRPDDLGAASEMPPTVPVTVVTSRAEADLVVGMLRNNGLTAAVSADDAGGQEPQLQAQGVRVLVAPADEATARRLLSAADDPPSQPSPPRQPGALRRWMSRLRGGGRS